MNSAKKILGWQSLKTHIGRWRKKGKKIAFTNGCFDLLHAGHVRYLEDAKTQNRILVVGLNSDASIRRIKGPSRPINGQKQRAAVLAALACVDYVTLFPEDTPYRLIKTLQPDILIKGADWKDKGVVGSEIVEGRGGRVELIRFLPGLSTTTLIEKIQKRERGSR